MTGPNREAVDIHVDDGVKWVDPPRPEAWVRCLVCKDKVGPDAQHDGICDQCRELEGSVWDQDW